jgi:Cu/Ag efflux pump CusA
MNTTRSMLRVLSASTAGIEYAVKPRGTSFEQVLRPEANDIICRITGGDTGTVERLAEIYDERIRVIKGLVDLRVSQQEGIPEYRITVDREAASRHGLSVQAVATHLVQHVRGDEATTLSDFDRKIAVRVQPSMQSRGINALLASALPGAGNAGRSLIECRERAMLKSA